MVEASPGMPSWIHVAHLVLTVLIAIYSWVAASSRANRTEITAMERRIDGMSRKLSTVEERLRHTPSSEATSELLATTRELRAELEGFKRAVGRIDERFDRYEEHVLRRGA
jgi:phage shock protein A